MQINNKIKFAKVRETGIIPTKNKEDAGYDIYVDWTADTKEDRDFHMILPHETRILPTGIACALPEDYYFQIEERGSTGSKGIKNSAGVVDAGYRGEIFLAITNANNKPIIFYDGEKPGSIDAIEYPKNKALAQLVLHKIPELEVEEISYEDLKSIPSLRFTGSLGSSGK